MVAVVASGIGGYYMLLQIEEAKNLPEPISAENIFNDEYPSKPVVMNRLNNTKHNGGLQKDMDDV